MHCITMSCMHVTCIKCMPAGENDYDVCGCVVINLYCVVWMGCSVLAVESVPGHDQFVC